MRRKETEAAATEDVTAAEMQGEKMCERVSAEAQASDVNSKT